MSGFSHSLPPVTRSPSVSRLSLHPRIRLPSVDINVLCTRLLLARREHILRSEQLSLRCNDPTCGWQTALLPVRRSSAIMQQGQNAASAVNGALELNEAPCPAIGCRGGRLKPQTTAQMLHNQLWYFSYVEVALGTHSEAAISVSLFPLESRLPGRLLLWSVSALSLLLSYVCARAPGIISPRWLFDHKRAVRREAHEYFGRCSAEQREAPSEKLRGAHSID
jgi:hypothetical protein